jgi:hypothetical protein
MFARLVTRENDDDKHFVNFVGGRPFALPAVVIW